MYENWGIWRSTQSGINAKFAFLLLSKGFLKTRRNQGKPRWLYIPQLTREKYKQFVYTQLLMYIVTKYSILIVSTVDGMLGWSILNSTVFSMGH